MRLTRRKRLMLVTGGSGFLGRHVAAASETGRWELLAPPSRALDVRLGERVSDDVAAWKPNVVVHLAYRRDERRTIVEGSRNVAAAAASAGARLVHVSTDFVFAGRERPYRETDRPDSDADYGRWKAQAEAAVVDACPNAVVVRTSLLYGTDLLSVPQLDVEAALTGRSSMRFFTDEYRCPAHAADVAAAIVDLADRPEIEGVVHVAGPAAVSRAELARAFARWAGYDPSRVPVGPRPTDGSRALRIVLDTTLATSMGLSCRPLAETLRLR